MSSELPVELALPSPEAAIIAVSDLAAGEIRNNVWELDLDKLFEDSLHGGLTYTLSDDLNGAAAIENGVLSADLEKLPENVSFRVTAENAYGQTAELPIVLAVAFPETKLDQQADLLEKGRFSEDGWALDLNGLFEDPKGTALRYTLSDDCGGAVSIDNSILTVRPEGMESFSFTVTATDSLGLKTALPFELRFQLPIVKIDGVSETVKTGLFQKGTWEKELNGLFEDPNGTALSYTLSDDYAGRLRIEEENAPDIDKDIADYIQKLESADGEGKENTK